MSSWLVTDRCAHVYQQLPMRVFAIMAETRSATTTIILRTCIYTCECECECMYTCESLYACEYMYTCECE